MPYIGKPQLCGSDTNCQQWLERSKLWKWSQKHNSAEVFEMGPSEKCLNGKHTLYKADQAVADMI